MDEKAKKILLSGFVNHSIIVADKFIRNIRESPTGRALIVETLRGLMEIREEAELLKKRFEI